MDYNLNDGMRCDNAYGNRQIIFKAKRLDTREWVIGDLSRHKSGKVFIKVKDGSALQSYEVDTDTVCQYTGVNNNYGQMIWENDLLGHPCNRVDYVLGMFVINGDRPLWMFRDLKVIGNYHDLLARGGQ